MKITTVTVRHQQTYNLGNYSNIKPEIALTAECEANEDISHVVETLDSMATAYIHNKVDDALEQQGDPPAFYTGPRFSIIIARDERIAAIVPYQADLPPVWDEAAQTVLAGFRKEAAMKTLTENYASWRVVNCSDGDLTKLPPLEKFRIFSRDGYTVLVPGTVAVDDLPGLWANRYQTNQQIQYRLPFSLLDEFTGERIINCLDGDLTRIAGLLKPEEEDEEEEFDDDEEDKTKLPPQEKFHIFRRKLPPQEKFRRDVDEEDEEDEEEEFDEDEDEDEDDVTF